MGFDLEEGQLLSQSFTNFISVQKSLSDLLGEEYTRLVCEAASFLTGADLSSLQQIATTKVDFFPDSFHHRLLSLLPNVGKICCAPLNNPRPGSTSRQFANHSKLTAAPLSGFGFYRVGEDGRLFFISKSEHYHCSLGHRFPGYSLVEYAKQLGIPNATHNNTRGTITRILEEELVRTASAIPEGDSIALQNTLTSNEKSVLNRVLNLETGSIAAEAAIKLVLSRFYKPQENSPAPQYSGKIPVLVVIGDDDHGLIANYHGTTIVAQLMRGMWPEMFQRIETHQIFLVKCIQTNNWSDVESVFSNYESDRYKIAGIFHELVLMNYGAKRLHKEFVKKLYTLCELHDVPTVVDEIQTCAWSPNLYMFHEYQIKPSIVVVGKGFPGGEYAASRILFNSTLDLLPQFGALVTNGQEELASLCYLITMNWIEANAEIIRSVGDYYEERLRDLAQRYPDRIYRIEGARHLAGLYFQDLDIGIRFVNAMNEMGMDISVQTYKQNCPPVALTKLPLISGYEVVDLVINRIQTSLNRI